MRRSTLLLGAIALAGMLPACNARRSSSRTVASRATGQPCPVRQRGAFLGVWNQVRSEGFTFCVPTGWSIDERYARVHAARQSSTYRLLSYASDDASQRVVFEVPSGGNLLTKLKVEFERCEAVTPDAAGMIGDVPVCIRHASIDNTTPPVLSVKSGRSAAVTPPIGNKSWMNTQVVTFSTPHVRAWATGPEVAWSVLQTVRPADAASRF